MVEIVGQVSILGFSELLDSGETFKETNSNKTLVTLEEKLKAIYEAIFVTIYSGNNNQYHTIIGDMEFTAQTKGMLMRIAGLLSEYTKFDID